MQRAILFYSTHGLTTDLVRSAIEKRLKLESTSIALFEREGEFQVYDVASESYVNIDLGAWGDYDLGAPKERYPLLTAEEAELMESSRWAVFNGNSMDLLRWSLLALLELVANMPGEGWIYDELGHLVPWRDFLTKLISDPTWNLECGGPGWSSRVVFEAYFDE